MVPIFSIVNMFVSLILCFGFPIALVIYFVKQKKSTLKVFFIGILGFFVPQIMIRIPLLAFLGTQDWFIAFAQNTLPYIIALAFTAGLFETFGRFFVFKLMLKKHRSHGDGMMAGLGHGGVCIFRYT
jgi:uncharacterized membrane protein YhfC